MRYVLRALLAGGLGLAVSFLVACGGGAGLLSSNQASNLNGQLDQVASAVGSGQCGAATQAVTGFSNAVDNLPSSINPTLVNNLKQGASTVGALAGRDCRTQSTATTTTPTTSTATVTTSTSTATPPTTTSAPTPTPRPTTPATTTTPSGTSSTPGGSGGAGLGAGSGGAGNGNGNGNGQ